MNGCEPYLLNVEKAFRPIYQKQANQTFEKSNIKIEEIIDLNQLMPGILKSCLGTKYHKNIPSPDIGFTMRDK